MPRPSIDLFARALAHAEAAEQAAFLNAFVHELRQVCRDGRFQKAHYQWSWIADALDGEAREAFTDDLPNVIVAAKESEAQRHQKIQIDYDVERRLRDEIRALEQRKAELES